MKKFGEFILENTENKIYVNMIVVSDNDKILIMRRANYMKKFPGLWGFPGGSYEKSKDKTIKDGAIRELKEETQIELTFNENRKCREFAKIKNKDNSISYYFLVELETSPIDNIKISKEHSKYDWYSFKEQKQFKWMPDVFQLIQEYYER